VSCGEHDCILHSWPAHISSAHPDSLNYAAPTTLVWGDGNAANGCPPKITPCIDANDKIYAGQSFVIQTPIPASPRVRSNIFFDAGDRVQASLPIAVTRGAFPQGIGSVIAGATDVYDTTVWGRSFKVPMGPNVPKSGWFSGSGSTAVDWFEHTALYFMAAEDNTIVTKPDGTNVTLKQGENGYALAKMGDNLISNKDIQVHAVTGDVLANYEMRWFSLLPRVYCTLCCISNCESTVVAWAVQLILDQFLLLRA
jgi:hypothetical protein